VIRVLIAEDETDAAVALKLNLDGRDDIQVIGLAANGQEAIRMCRLYHPDLVLMDIQMPVMDGIEASEVIKRENPTTRILILTLFSDQKLIEAARRVNSNGYILKGRPSSVIINCIKQAMLDFYISDQTIIERLDESLVNNQIQPEDQQRLSLLTQNDRQIIHLIVQGLTTQEIAEKLCFSNGTIRNQISSIINRLDLPNSKALAVWGFRMGL
jgi:DNA-binding NarL/FixJ family response regulator